ncbi:DUF3105 domain-containing protein [Streptomyces sp. GC420]|uniref:DUF3105 domain-containing protein n=1 Tax=Streptomyces sp. GC420 TaxID=2697568 RepID=UPI001414FF36|nr:DUF3105 domain-containing protein [Streptomyces sp. GC420]NBM16961.1 DUF3105 domain-containing protein [Streptomyces sp. GC420]
MGSAKTNKSSGTKNSPKRSAANDRRAKIEEARRLERARERRMRVITIVASAAIVTALAGGVWYFLSEDKKQEQAAAAARDADIKGVKTWKDLTQNHVSKPVDYPMNPPVGGDHNQVWMNCDADVYAKEIPNENAVHSLEHGAVWVTYNDKAAAADVERLKKRVSATTYSLMSPVPDQDSPIVLSAWGAQLKVGAASDSRVEAFFDKYVQGKQTPEPGAACTGGRDA